MNRPKLNIDFAMKFVNEIVDVKTQFPLFFARVIQSLIEIIMIGMAVNILVI